jgi:putative NADPH-quinone reductase
MSANPKNLVRKNIVVIQGHPDSARRYGHALAEAYVNGARSAGHAVRVVDVASIDFPLLRNPDRWKSAAPPDSLQPAQDAIAWADHLVLFFPLWLGTMPALLKGFLEQVLRPGFALIYEGHRFPQKGLTGKSARVVVTMGMPAFWYRWFFRAQGVRGLERSILGFCGVKPVRESFVGLVESKDDAGRRKWLVEMARLGRKAL